MTNITFTKEPFDSLIQMADAIDPVARTSAGKHY